MTPTIHQWAQRHGVTPAALDDLARIFGMHGGHHMPERVTGTSEAAVQACVRLEAPLKGVTLWRNNVGALLDDRGVPVRYGLANDSKALNEVLKSADLIGWRPVWVTQAMVGTRLAVFVSRECKARDWRYRGDAREVAQLNWITMLTRDGGDAGFCTGEGTL